MKFFKYNLSYAIKIYMLFFIRLPNLKILVFNLKSKNTFVITSCYHRNKYNWNFLKILFNAFLLFITLFFISCKAVEAPSAGFIKNPEVMYKDPMLPFHKVWFYKYLNLLNYNRIIIKPIKLRYLNESGDIERLNARYYMGYTKKDEDYVVKYMREEFIRKFKAVPNNRFKVVNNRGYGTLVLEMAIVELVPTKAELNAAGDAFVFVPIGPIPLSILITLITLPIKTVLGGVFESGFKSHIAFEGVVRDSMTNKIILAYADREAEKASLVNVKDYTYFAHVRSIISEWALQTVKMLNRTNNDKIEDSSAFVFQPW